MYLPVHNLPGTSTTVDTPPVRPLISTTGAAQSKLHLPSTQATRASTRSSLMVTINSSAESNSGPRDPPQEFDVPPAVQYDWWLETRSKAIALQKTTDHEPVKLDNALAAHHCISNSAAKSDNAFPDAIFSTVTLPNDTHAAVQDQIPAMNTIIDTRLPYRQGWPLLPTLPVHTSREQVPKTLCQHTLHMAAFRSILAKNHVDLLDKPAKVEIVHRFNPGTYIGRNSLTLLIQADISCNGKWAFAISCLRTYIEDQGLTLAVEIIDPRVVNGLYTLPILAHDPVAAVVTKRKHGIVQILKDCGEQWAGLDFYYRGMGRRRAECKPTVLIGVPEPNLRVWWEEVLPKVREKVRGKLEVEICWREVVKC
jgi:hypothetical protein